MSNNDQWLTSIAKRMKEERKQGAAPVPERLTARDFLYNFGARRRGPIVVSNIRNQLEKTGLRTEPDFESIGSKDIDREISIVLALKPSNDSKELPDPTHRIGSLVAADKKLETVTPNDPLTSATTKMRINDYSRLPVMNGERDLKGIISWQSIGERLTSDVERKEVHHWEVRHCMAPESQVMQQVIHEDISLFDAIKIITKYDYVLVRDRKDAISGIVTASDLSNQFEKITGPFLFVGEIERHLRNLIDGKFTIPEMKGDREIANDGEIAGTADLTFGDYEHLLGKPDYWKRLALPGINRKDFIKYLQLARLIRNNIMHFDPDGITSEDLEALQKIAGLLEKLAH